MKYFKNNMWCKNDKRGRDLSRPCNTVWMILAEVCTKFRNGIYKEVLKLFKMYRNLNLIRQIAGYATQHEIIQNLSKIVEKHLIRLKKIIFTLYPVHSRVGRGNLLLRQSVPHFLPNSGSIACWVAAFNAALSLDTRAKKWKFLNFK